MSGFFSVFYALNMCDKVDLYGFDAYTSKKKSYRYHYFDDVQVRDASRSSLWQPFFDLVCKRGSRLRAAS
jgi:hypothetical protein